MDTRGSPFFGVPPTTVKLKGIDGGPHKRRNMWFNSMIREEPYPGSNLGRRPPETEAFRKDGPGGAAWLSSARAVRCRLKCHNERNPLPRLPSVRPGTPRVLPPQGARKEGMTSNQHGPYVRGYTRVTMAATGGSQQATARGSPKAAPVRTGVCNPTPRSRIR